ncbi:hypothetical protein F66182_6004 [Fusarium sp. NRRL 66182]|nr:hypothetical protein F66182_6004 [Fusarium sp. NRRL 66182]
MSRNLSLYQHTNHLAYCELLSATSNLVPTETLNEDASKEETAREFVRFETAFTEIIGAHDQLLDYALTQENLARDEDRDVGPSSSDWAKINDAVREEVIEINSKVQAAGSAGLLQPRDVVNDQDAAEVGRYTDEMVQTGIPNQALREAVVPASSAEMMASAERKSGINNLILRWVLAVAKPFTSILAPDSSSRQDVDQTPAEALYRALATQKCSAKQHRALLQLSNSTSSDEVLYLSCEKPTSRNTTWHKTICRFDGSVTKTSASAPGSPNAVCSLLDTARRRSVPLHLSFNNDSIWLTRGLPDGHKIDRKACNTTSLQATLSQGHVKTSDLNHDITKFRLAHRLALSLYRLCSSSWIQQTWDMDSIQIRLGETLDEAYIECVLLDAPTPFQHCVDGRPCLNILPKTFAQVLISLAKGGHEQTALRPDDSFQWYRLLGDEVEQKRDDKLMGDFWTAVEGCLVYLPNLEDQDGTALDSHSERFRAQKVIKDYIVDPLRRNLEFWIGQQKVQDSFTQDQDPGDNTRLSSKRASSRVPVTRRFTESKFTLWSSEDEDRPRANPTTEVKQHSFINYMERFLDTYITPLRAKAVRGTAKQRVRVAIIDTGFHVDNGDDWKISVDPFLFHADLESRIRDKKNFFSPDDKAPDPDDWHDTHGHGTHVARLLLKWAPEADIYIAKITNTKSLTGTRTKQLREALRWAGERADMINLSFSLGHCPDPDIKRDIERLVTARKLIFAAASNTGGYGRRLWPASELGVFGIHATDEFNTPIDRINPPAQSCKDNFAIYGCDVESFWRGNYTLISGTSFACPVAAAVAANILEFARHQLPEEVAENLERYSVMNRLLCRLTENYESGQYHCFRPWAEGFWDEEGHVDDEHLEEIRKELKKISIY